jgi:hypothetical protein
LRLLVMVMKVGDKLVDVQLGERARRIGGLCNRVRWVVGRHGFCDHRKKIVDLFGRGVGDAGVCERLVGVVDKRTEIDRIAEQVSREIEDRHDELPPVVVYVVPTGSRADSVAPGAKLTA